jgi:epoxyqueuosine reductase QueG
MSPARDQHARLTSSREGGSRRVTVCDACLTACCWHGVLMCSKARAAGTTTRTVAELDALAYEDPSHYSLGRVREVEGR